MKNEAEDRMIVKEEYIPLLWEEEAPGEVTISAGFEPIQSGELLTPYKRYVVGFMFSEDGEHVLLIKKLKPEWQKGLYNGIGGKVEEGESPIEAMVREFEEEAGLKTIKEDWQEVVHYYCPEECEIIFYEAFDDRIYEAGSKTQEKITVRATLVLPVMDTIPNLQWLIPLCFDRTIELPVTVYKKED